MRNYLIIFHLILFKALSFDLSAQTSIDITGAGTYISIEDAPEINLSEFTVECWFMMKDTGITVTTGVNGVNAFPLVSKGIEEDVNSAYMNYFLGIRKEDSVLVADFEESVINYHKGRNHPVTGFTSVRRNVWYHAAVTYDSKFLSLYLDGDLESAVEVSRLPMNQSTINAVVGSVLLSGGSSAGYFHGKVDEVRIWNYALSQQEIQDNINNEILSALPGLVLRLGLNEGSGDEISYTGMPGLNINIIGANYGWSEGTNFENINPPACNATPDLKIGLIADAQYCDCDPAGTRFYRETMWKLPDAVDTLNKYNVDFVMTLGDIIDRYYESFDSVLPKYEDLNMPDYKLLGNHEYDVIESRKDTVRYILNMPDYYYDFTYGDWRFIILDGTELADYDSILHMDLRDEADSVWQSVQGEINDLSWNGGIGRTQSNWIESRITDAMDNYEKVILFCHFPLYPEHELNLWNRFQIMDIVEKYENVVAYISGHNHEGNYAFRNSKHYITQKGMVETFDTCSFSILNFYNNKLVFNSYGLMNDQVLTFRNFDKKPFDILLSDNILTYDLDSVSYIGSFSTADSSSSAGYSYGLIDTDVYGYNNLFHISGDSLFLNTEQDISLIENITIKAASKNCNLDTVSGIFTFVFDTVAVSLISNIQDTVLIPGQPDLTVNLDSIFSDRSEYGLLYTANSGNESKAKVLIDNKNLVVEPLKGGSSVVTVIASDTYTGQSVSDTFIVAVFDPLNHVPAVQNPPGDLIVQMENDSLVIDLDSVFYDEDNDTLLYKISCINDTTVYYIADSTLLTVYPLNPGEDSVIISADDDRGGHTGLSFKVTVNTSPVAKYPYSEFLTQIFYFFPDVNLDTIFSDPDGNILVYNIDSVSSGIITADITGTELHIDYLTSGNVVVYVSADDSSGGCAYWELHLTINAPPQVIVNIPDLTLTLIILKSTSTQSFNLDTIFFDSDGDSLVYLVNNSNPGVLEISENGPELILWAAGKGISQVDILAEDQMGGIATDTFNVTVVEPSNIILYSNRSGSILTNYPNPFRQTTVLKYKLYKSSLVEIKLYNQYGEPVMVLASGHQLPGLKEIPVNAENLSPGLYFCRMMIDNEVVEVNKMVIVK
jgi:manganese-dependent ADP-ribose/CDP-alcohol diphosphatase